MSIFSDVNNEPVAAHPSESGNVDSRFRLISRLISTPDVLSDGEREFRALEKLIKSDFLAMTSNVGMPGESKMYAKLLELLEDLHELVNFPYLANKNILAVGGEFSAGKSRFLNSIFGEENLLPTDPNPTTAIPTYLIYGDDEKISALNSFSRLQTLSKEELNAISHGFNANQADASNRISFYHVLRLLQVQSPSMKRWPNIAFLDTPGYSKPKENIDDEVASEGTDAGNTDEEKARENLSTADYLIWVVSAKDGTFQQPGIAFLRDKVQWTKPLYLLINKVDQIEPSERKRVCEQIRDDARKAGFNVVGVSAYSSREAKVYLKSEGHDNWDDPVDWFKAVDGKRKLTKWRGRFKSIIDEVIRFCNNVEAQCADYEKVLKRLEADPEIEGELSSKVKGLRKEITERRRRRQSAASQIAEFSEKVEVRLNSLLKIIGVSDETAADNGLVAVSVGDDKFALSKKGDSFTATVERYSKFNGCYLNVQGYAGQVQIRRSMTDTVTDAAKVFAVGREFELKVYEVNHAQRQVTFNVCL